MQIASDATRIAQRTLTLPRNPILDFEIDKSALQYIGRDLQRPECILAERDGTLWSADSRGGIMKISPSGEQRYIGQKTSDYFAQAAAKTAQDTATASSIKITQGA